MRPTIDPSAIESLLLVRLSSIGDVVFALPALETLRAHLPKARIGWVVEDRAADLLVGHPAIDELHVMPRKAWRRRRAEGASRMAVLREMRHFGRSLAARQFGVALDLQGNLKSGLVSWASRAPLRIGLAASETREPNWLFSNRRLVLGRRPIHRIERDLEIVAALGLPYEFRWPRFGWSEEDERDARTAGAGIESGERLVVLNPGTSAWFKSKRWPADRWAELARRLAAVPGVRVLVNHGPGEEDIVEALLDEAGDAVHRAVCLPTMRAVGRLIRRADLVVGSDTGPVHLAALSGVPTIILFGPYDPRHYYPFQQPGRALYQSIPCSPCRYRDCPVVACMREIAVDAVWERCRAALEGAPVEPILLRPRKTIRI